MVTKCIMSKCVFSIDRIAVSGGSASSQCTSTCSFGGEFVQLVGLQVAQMYNSHANRLRARKVRISAGRFVDTHTHTHTRTHTHCSEQGGHSLLRAFPFSALSAAAQAKQLRATLSS